MFIFRRLGLIPDEDNGNKNQPPAQPQQVQPQPIQQIEDEEILIEELIEQLAQEIVEYLQTQDLEVTGAQLTNLKNRLKTKIRNAITSLEENDASDDDKISFAESLESEMDELPDLENKTVLIKYALQQLSDAGIEIPETVVEIKEFIKQLIKEIIDYLQTQDLDDYDQLAPVRRALITRIKAAIAKLEERNASLSQKDDFADDLYDAVNDDLGNPDNGPELLDSTARQVGKLVIEYTMQPETIKNNAFAIHLIAQEYLEPILILPEPTRTEKYQIYYSSAVFSVMQSVGKLDKFFATRAQIASYIPKLQYQVDELTTSYIYHDNQRQMTDEKRAQKNYYYQVLQQVFKEVFNYAKELYGPSEG